MKIKSAFLFLLVCFMKLNAQQQSIKEYEGVWRWVSGNQDTFIVALRPNRNKLFGNIDPATVLSGFHRYVEKGQVMESNLFMDRDAGVQKNSIAATFQKNGTLTIALFRDFTRSRVFQGTFIIVDGSPVRAIWSVGIPQERNYLFEERDYPRGQTVPDNIVLEKIGN